MHNPTRSDVQLAIKGRTFHLTFDLESIAEAEELSGKSLLTGIRRNDFDAPSIRLVQAMLYGCAKKLQPELTYADARALVTPRSIHDIWVKVLEAWAADMAEPDEDQSPDPIPDQN